MSVCMSAVSAGISEVLIKYTGKYVKIYFIMKITYDSNGSLLSFSIEIISASHL